jgi:hypothetical protein
MGLHAGAGRPGYNDEVIAGLWNAAQASDLDGLPGQRLCQLPA